MVGGEEEKVVGEGEEVVGGEAEHLTCHTSALPSLTEQQHTVEPQ